MDRADYERLKGAIEEDYRKNLEALETVWRLSERYPAPALEVTHTEFEPVGDASDPATEAPQEEPIAETGEVKQGVPDFVGDPGPEEEPEEESVEPEEAEKTCSKCGETKPREEFYKDSKSPDGLNVWCRSYHRAAAKERAERKRAKKSGRNDSAPAYASGRPAQADEVTRPETTGAERVCASGPRCVKADPDDLYPQPAILDAANPGPLCRGCQKRAGVAA